jgi:hypothetical protein
MIRMKDTKKLWKSILRSLPAIPFIAPKKETPIVPLVLGALGIVVAGGIAAVLILSPRTRYRALDAAKGGYGKVRGQLDHLGLADKLGGSHRERSASIRGPQNGLVSEGADYQSSGI